MRQEAEKCMLETFGGKNKVNAALIIPQSSLCGTAISLLSYCLCVYTVRWVLCNAGTSPRFLPSGFWKLSESRTCLCGSLGSSPLCK